MTTATDPSPSRNEAAKSVDAETFALLEAVREFVSYGMCRQANQRERDMLARRFEELAKKHKPLLTKRGMDPSQMCDLDFQELRP